MNLYLITAVVTLLTAASVIYYYVRGYYLRSLLNPEISGQLQADIGGTLSFGAGANPKKNIKADFVEGSLICKRFTGYTGGWFDWTNLPFLSRGEVFNHHLVFIVGKDLLFVPDSNNSYEMKIPIPEDASATYGDNFMQIRWRLSLTYKVKGYPPVAVSGEAVIKTADYFSKSMIQNENETLDTQPAFVQTGRKNKGTTQKDKQVLILGNTGHTQHQTTESSKSSFNFIELEGGQSDDSLD